MNRKIYRICLISLTVLAVFAACFYYNRLKEPAGNTQGALFVMEECNEQSDNLS